MNRDKVKNYLGLSRKAGMTIIGADNLKNYNKKLYLVLVDSDLSNTQQKMINKFKEREVEVLLIENLGELIAIDNCKIVGIKNNGLALEIIKNIRGE